MAAFELTNGSCDGHIRALSRAILMASRLSKDALLEFTPDKLRLCARADLYLVKSSVLVPDRDAGLRTSVVIKCQVEDEINNQIVFRIGADQPAASLTYRLPINDLDSDRMVQLNAINRTISFARVEIAPKQSKKDRFLLSAFNNFAPDIDQVTIKTNQNEVKFIGSSCPLLSVTNTTSEFTHKRDDFSTYNVKEDVNITMPLKFLKLFLNFVETNRVQTFPKYIFEGMGLPAHFIYDAQLFKGHFVTATPYEFIPAQVGDEDTPAIAMGADESFIADENIIEPTCGADEYNDIDYAYAEEDDQEENEYGYNDNESVTSDHLDGNLEGFDTSRARMHHNVSLYGAESIRSELGGTNVNSEKAKEILDLDQDPDDNEDVQFQYSSDSSDY